MTSRAEPRLVVLLPNPTLLAIPPPRRRRRREEPPPCCWCSVDRRAVGALPFPGATTTTTHCRRGVGGLRCGGLVSFLLLLLLRRSQIVCHGCRSVLRYPSGAPSVCCALCQAITTVPPPAPVMEMAHLICGGCRTLLMYTRNADTVRCSCCSTVNLVRPVNNIAHVSCGQCRTTLMYPYGAPSVKCAICHYITNTGPTSRPQNVTVVVENPMTVDEKGKLVSNVVVGVTTGK
uniref:Zinc finger LSD1-type domain-containing protein n=2 Tax=Oryza TaxID=4527 RepID=A0A0D3FLM1_9ORYZ